MLSVSEMSCGLKDLSADAVAAPRKLLQKTQHNHNIEHATYTLQTAAWSWTADRQEDAGQTQARATT